MPLLFNHRKFFLKCKLLPPFNMYRMNNFNLDYKIKKETKTGKNGVVDRL